MAKMKIIFDGFEDLAYRLDEMGKDLKPAVNEALEETQKIVSDNLTTAAAPYAGKGLKGYATGKMYGAIKKDKRVEWSGSIAKIGVGFSSDSMAGFYHSIFVMYGTPKMSKDTKVYNAIRGARTQSEIAETQEKIMRKYLGD